MTPFAYPLDKQRKIRKQLDRDFRDVYRRFKRTSWQRLYKRSLSKIHDGFWRISWLGTNLQDLPNRHVDVMLHRGTWWQRNDESHGAYAILTTLSRQHYQVRVAVRHEDWDKLPDALRWFANFAWDAEGYQEKVVPMLRWNEVTGSIFLGGVLQ